MALTPEEIKDLKAQLYEQVKHLPEDKKILAQQQIDSLSPEALEQMLSQSQSKGKQNSGPEKSIFRKIVDKDIPSYFVEETKEAFAVLDIYPISKGHTIILPKKIARDSKEIPSSAFSLAKRISNRIIKRLEAKSTEIQTENKFGESIIHIIPSYNEPKTIDSQRTTGKPEELESIAKQIKHVIKPKTIKIKKTSPKDQSSSLLKIPRRIP
jgi:histidine triad (HIT) family protein